MGPPGVSWGLPGYALFLLRSKTIEVLLLRNSGEAKPVHYLFMLLGVLDHFDLFTDGAYPVQAYRCDGSLTDGFADAFLESKVPVMATAVTALRFWGLAALLLLAAGLTQQATVGVHSVAIPAGLYAADVSGMAGVACLLDEGACGCAPYAVAV